MIVQETGKEREGEISFCAVTILQQCSLLTADISFPQLLFNVHVLILVTHFLLMTQSDDVYTGMCSYALLILKSFFYKKNFLHIISA